LILKKGEMMMEFRNNEEKVLYVLESIHRGRDQNQIARDLGYKNYKSLDMFMRREGYVKEKRLGNYLPKNGKGIVYDEIASRNTHVSTKALEVIQLFKKEELSPKMVAYEAGFESSKEMASYMKSKGLIWDSNRNNYVMEQTDVDAEVIRAYPEEKVKEQPHIKEETNDELPADIEKYMDLLKYLDSRKEKITELIECTMAGEAGQMPRYVIPGVFITKSVHMSNQLDQMIRDFSDEKNISQKEIFEIALIDFLKKYGYHKEVSVMLSQLG